MRNNLIEFIIPLIGLNISLIIINRVLWLQILIIGALVAEVGAVLIYNNIELLGISILIIYNGALLVLFTLSLLLVIPAQIRPAKDIASWWFLPIVILITQVTASGPTKVEVGQLQYTHWLKGFWENELMAINIGLYDRYSQEFLGITLLLLAGIFSTLKILKN